MTQHPSLKGGSGSSKFRSVLKRYEKIKDLDEKDKWDESKDSIYKLPKIKRLKFKVKKTKGPSEEKDEEGKDAQGAAVKPGAEKDKAGAAKKTAGK